MDCFDLPKLCFRVGSAISQAITCLDQSGVARDLSAIEAASLKIAALDLDGLRSRNAANDLHSGAQLLELSLGAGLQVVEADAGTLHLSVTSAQTATLGKGSFLAQLNLTFKGSIEPWQAFRLDLVAGI